MRCVVQVPVGGCYRLIDIPMSNCINSTINKIFVLTQFNSASLNRHISRTYFGNGVNFGDGFVEVSSKFHEYQVSKCYIFYEFIVLSEKFLKKDLIFVGVGCYSNIWWDGNELVPRNCRCREAIYMGFWGSFVRSFYWLNTPSKKLLFNAPIRCFFVLIFFLVNAGCQEQGYWGYTNLVRWSSLPYGLSEPFAGMHILYLASWSEKD